MKAYTVLCLLIIGLLFTIIFVQAGEIRTMQVRYAKLYSLATEAANLAEQAITERDACYGRR